MNRLSRNKKTGLTLVELIIATLMLSLIFLAISSVYFASQKFQNTSAQKINVGYELQYAVQHIYKNTMLAIGDQAISPLDVVSSERVELRIPNNYPVAMSNYNDVTIYSYYKADNAIMFSNGVTQESLIPKVLVTDVNFIKNGNVLTGYIAAKYNSQGPILTYYFACYPRHGSFN